MSGKYEWVERGIKKKDGFYFIDYRDAGNRRVQEKIGTSLQFARSVLGNRLNDKAKCQFLNVAPQKRMLFADYARKYLKYSRENKAEGTSTRDRFSVLHLKKFFGELCLEEISQAKIDDYKSQRLEKVTPSTVNRETSCLDHMLNMAVEWEILREKPFKKIRKMKEPPGRIRYLTLEEIPRLLRECSARIRLIVFMALNTGMRKGELLALRWSDINTRNRIVHVEKTKSHNRRDIPINKPLLEMLTGRERTGDKVFEGVKNFRKAFDNAVMRAGITNFHFHDLRHSFASHLVMQGTSILLVKELLGHKTLEMTLRYAHLSPDLRVPACEAMGKITGGFLETIENEPTETQ